MAEHLDIGRRSTYDRLARLVEQGYLETKKVGGNGRVWWRPPDDTAPGTPHWNDTTDSLVDVLDGADVGVFVLDEDFEVAWLNDATERYFGLDRKNVLGRDKRRLIEEQIAPRMADSKGFAETLRATYDDNTSTERFECHVTASSQRRERWLEHRSKPIETGGFAGGRVELYYDVTDRKRAERARREEREEFERLIDAVAEYAIFTLDVEGHVQSWNPGAERIKGYDADEIRGEHFSTFYTTEDREAGIPERNLSVAATDGSIEDEGWRVRADGSRFWANVTITAIHDEKGDLQGFAKVTRDTTERHEYEKELRDQRDYIQQLLETVPIGVVTVEQDGTFTTANQQAVELLELDGDEKRTVGVNAVYDEDGEFLPPHERPYVTVFETGQSVRNWHARLERSDGSRRWLSTNIEPIHDENGTVERALITIKDISHLKEQAMRLERQRDDLEAELDEVFERVEDGFYALDEEFRFDYINDTAATHFGTRKGELLGQTIWDALDVDDDDRIIEEFERAMSTQEPRRFEHDSDLLGVWAAVTIYPSATGLSVYFRDITERKQYERDLEESERRYRTLVENFPNGVVALVDEECRYVTVGGEPPDALGISPAEIEGRRPSEVLSTDIANLIGPGYETALDGEPSNFVAEIGEQIYQFQIVPVRDDDGDVFAALGLSQDITQRRKRKRALERHRERLAALNNLNEIVHDITEAVIEQSSRDEIEAIVCERLAAADSYEFAWIGDTDAGTRTVNLRAEAGVDGYLDDITISVDSRDERSHGPTGRAFRTGEIQTTQNITADPKHDPWREHVQTYDIQSSAAIPLVHEGTVYGVLNVYADRPEAFEGQEQRVIGQLGEIVGHAIAAADRKRALMSDEVVELKFQIHDVFDALGVDTSPAGRITLDQAVPLGDEEFLIYGTATEDALENLRALVESVPHWIEMTSRDDYGETAFEVRLSEPPVLSKVAAVGGSVESVCIADGDLQMRIHVAPTTDVREIIDTVQMAYPAAEMVKRRQTTRRDTTGGRQNELVAELTDRQRTALEVAVYSGYFEWPREETGEDVADSVGIAAPTFHQHLRKAQRKVFESLFSVPDASNQTT